MTKKVAFLVFILFSGLAVLFYVIQQGSRNLLTDPYKLIPADALFFIESSNLPGLLNSVAENNGLFKEFAKIEGVDNFAAKFNLLRNFFNRNDIMAAIENQKSILSFHSDVDKKLKPLLVLTVPENVGSRNIKEFFSPAGVAITDKSRHGAYIINVLTLGDSINRQVIYYSFIFGAVVCSTSREVLLKAINHKEKKEDIRILPGLAKIISMATNREDKLFIVFGNLYNIAEKAGGIRSAELAERLSSFAECAEGDIFINENSYTFSGYIEIKDNTVLLPGLDTRTTGDLSTFNNLPSDCILFETIVFNGNPAKEVKTSDSVLPAGEFARKLMPYLENEATRSLVEFRTAGHSETGNLTVYKLKDRERAVHLFNERIKDWCNENNRKETDIITCFQPDDQIKIPVFSTPYKGFASVFFGRKMTLVADSLMAFYDNYLVTADRFEAVGRFLYDNILNKTISTDVDFREFEKTMPKRAGYFFWCKPSAIAGFLRDYINDTIIDRINSAGGILKKIKSTGYIMVPGEGMIYNAFSLIYAENITDEADTEWETKLDGSVTVKPFFFTNHNTGAKEIVVQDDRNNLYLINAAGRILWKIQTEERILGNIYMIDFYRNGKYQILFAGKNNLYIFDRNGNPVERYPVKLRSPASGPPALFDYDNNRNYRILIPGEDRLIYAYDKHGNVIKGWKPFRTNGIVTSEIKFFRISGKDYIVAADDKSVYFLDRTGNVRLKTSEPVTCAGGSEIRLNNLAEPSLVFTSTEGTLQFVSFDGKVRKITLNNFSPGHKFDFFDVDGDGYSEYVFIDRGKLYLYDHDRSEMFVRDFGTDNISGPVNFVFSSADRKTGVYNQLNNQIYLIDKNGNNMKGFPLRGFSKFSIGKLSEKGEYHLIVGGHDNFLYNYKLSLVEKD